MFPFFISAPTDVRGGRREGLDRRVVRADPGVRGLRPVGRHQLNVQDLKTDIICAVFLGLGKVTVIG